MGVEDNRSIIFVTGGDGGYGNLGDEWLADSVRLRYEKIKKKYKVIFLMQCPRPDGDGFFYVRDYLEDIKAMNVPINKIKAVHFYGGGYLNNYWNHLKLWFFDYLVEMGFSPKKIFFTGVGIGPLNLKNFIKIKKISNAVNYFGTRDGYNNRLIKNRFMFDESIYSIKNYKISGIKKDEILVNFRIADHVGIRPKNIKRMLAPIVNLAESSGYAIRYFPMIEQPGFSEKQGIIDTLKMLDIKETSVLDRPKNYKQLIDTIKASRLVVTTSYHATLASIYSGVPVIAVYGNLYYKIKFYTLRKILPTNLLEVAHINKLNDKIFVNQINATDCGLDLKIKKLIKVSDDAYGIYNKYLGIY